jgi:hypothetical protein
MGIPDLVEYLWLFAAPIGAGLAMLAVVFGLAMLIGSFIRIGMGDDNE